MSESRSYNNSLKNNLSAGDWLLPLRLVTGWTYFSAFWRRLVLENKLDPEAAGYIGEKFNHFLPNALLIKPAIEFFVSHPELLWWKLLAFTLVEAVVGFALMVGFMTRVAGIAVSLLALGILLGAGWIGTTCLDEWQIGILGVAAGMAFAFGGGGRFSLDHALLRRNPNSIWKHLLEFPEKLSLQRIALVAGAGAFGLALLTNQIFHGGVWGTLHNKSVRPMVELSEAALSPDGLHFTAYRVEGADVYGSFLIGVRLLDGQGRVQAEWNGGELAKISPADIANRYVAKIKPGAHSLVLPLGARARILLQKEELKQLAAKPDATYTLELIDVSGATWSAPVQIESRNSP